MPKQPLDLVGVSEIAERAKVRPDTVLKWRKRHADFPAPVKVLSMGPVWEWAKVEAWVKQPRKAGRKPQ